MIKRFVDLSNSERKILFKFMNSIRNKSYFTNYNEMIRNYESDIFNQGTTLFTKWYNNQLIGTIGAITKEIMTKQEAFITNFHLQEEYIRFAHDLIGEAEKSVKIQNPITIKLGIYSSRDYLIPNVLKIGYKKIYESLILKYKNTSKLEYISPNNPLHFKILTNSNMDDYIAIHNDSFLNSPNGATMTKDELMTEMKDQTTPECYGIAYLNDQAVGIYEVEINEVEQKGEIASIAISPKYQGNGYGKYILKEAIDVLKNNNMNNIELFMMSSNANAKNLYKKYGFIEQQVTSYWFCKTLTLG